MRGSQKKAELTKACSSFLPDCNHSLFYPVVLGLTSSERS
jgi:hypothetical protein